VTSRQTLWFTLSLAFVLAGLGALARVRGHVSGAIALSSCALLALAVLPSPRLRLALAKAWQWLTRPLRFAVPRVLLWVVYYLLVTPLGLLWRRTGRAVNGSKTGSNWRPREKERDPNSSFRMF
jgi:hypothetical protein